MPRPFVDTARIVTNAEPIIRGQTSARAADGSILDGQGVGIAIVDTGIDGTHPDLVYGPTTKRNLKVFYDRTIEMGNTDTTGGHGTAVAGVAAGRGAGLEAFGGTAPGAGLYGLGAGEAFSVFWAMKSFDWILDNHDRVDPPIRVVVNSWGSADTKYDPSSGIAWFTGRMVEEGITVVYAAGNEGKGRGDRTTAECNHPRPGVLCVGAYDDADQTSRTGRTASYSSAGDPREPGTWPDLVAPGTRVTSALALTGVTATGAWQESPSLLYTTLSGTSMAAPQVGAAAAILYQLDPKLTPAAIEKILTETAYVYDGGPDDEVQRGHGLLDIEAAVQRVLAGDPGTSGPAPIVIEPTPTESSDVVGDTIDEVKDLLGVARPVSWVTP